MQRLEFLGDSVLNFVIIEDLYGSYTDLSPRELSGLNETALSNELFARVAVKCGIQDMIWHNSDPLRLEIERYVGEIDFFSPLRSSRPPPKVRPYRLVW